MSEYTAADLTVAAANGTRYAYGHFGKTGTVPVVFFMHRSGRS